MARWYNLRLAWSDMENEFIASFLFGVGDRSHREQTDRLTQRRRGLFLRLRSSKNGSILADKELAPAYFRWISRSKGVIAGVASNANPEGEAPPFSASAMPDSSFRSARR